MVRFGYTINYVSDVDEPLSFFEKAFDMKRKFITEEKDDGELDMGETVLSFASHDLGKSNFQGSYVSASELKAPATKPWGQMVSYVRCPSGILLELCTPMGG